MSLLSAAVTGAMVATDNRWERDRTELKAQAAASFEAAALKDKRAYDDKVADTASKNKMNEDTNRSGLSEQAAQRKRDEQRAYNKANPEADTYVRDQVRSINANMDLSAEEKTQAIQNLFMSEGMMGDVNNTENNDVDNSLLNSANDDEDVWLTSDEIIAADAARTEADAAQVAAEASKTVVETRTPEEIARDENAERNKGVNDIIIGNIGSGMSAVGSGIGAVGSAIGGGILDGANAVSDSLGNINARNALKMMNNSKGSQLTDYELEELMRMLMEQGLDDSDNQAAYDTARILWLDVIRKAKAKAAKGN